jgi:octopine/nopaline transport system permease protein
MDTPFLLDTSIRLFAALPLTLTILAVSAVLATALGALLTAASVARSPALRGLQRGWTFLFRGTPLILQIFMIYYGLAMLPAIRHGMLWPAFREPLFCMCLALTCCCSAYIGEVFRGALRAVSASSTPSRDWPAASMASKE